VEMADGSQSMASLKPVGGIGKKSKNKLKLAKKKRRGNGKIKRNRKIWLQVKNGKDTSFMSNMNSYIISFHCTISFLFKNIAIRFVFWGTLVIQLSSF